MSTRVRVAMLILGLATLSQQLDAQTASLQSPRRERAATKEIFQAPLASPTEPASMLRYAGDGQIDFGLAQPFGFYRSEGKKSSWEIGLKPGIVSRLKVRETQLLLKAVDFRVGVPFSYHRGNWSTRVELFHMSRIAASTLPPRNLLRTSVTAAKSCRRSSRTEGPVTGAFTPGRA